MRSEHDASQTRDHPVDSPRPIRVERGFLARVPSSVLYSSGRTKVLCTATLEAGVPPFLEGRGRGWATAEYDLLPASTLPRKSRERSGKLSGRTQEIQRLIGRSMRATLNLERLSGWTLKIDCDVLEADGGTRTAAINGAWVATALVLNDAVQSGTLPDTPLAHQVSAVSVGIVDGAHMLDLNQIEDNRADVDLNLAMLETAEIVEVQGTAEGAPFSRDAFTALLDLAEKGIAEIRTAQLAALGTTREG